MKHKRGFFMRRVFVEKKEGFRHEAASVLQDIRECLHVPGLEGLRVVQRYDVEGLDDDARAWEAALRGVFAEPPVDDVFVGMALPLAVGEVAFAVEYLPGQFDQRADSAAQCVQILTCGERPRIASARIFVLSGNLSPEEVARIKQYLINPVDSREALLAMPEALAVGVREPGAVPVLEDFNNADAAALRVELGLAMSPADVVCCQRYFREVERRAPSLTEVRVLDTYWSDHCRHTTFPTQLEQVDFEEAPGVVPLRGAWDLYLQTRRELGREGKDVCLMDLATIAARALKRQGLLDDLEESEEINAASIVVSVDRQWSQGQWPELQRAIEATRLVEVDVEAVPAEVRGAFDSKSDGWRQKVIAWAKGILPQYVETRALGTVEITRNSIRSTISHGFGPLKLAVLPHAPDFLKNAMLLDYEEKSGGIFYNLMHRFSWENQIYVARLIVREDAQGKKFYDHEFSEINKLGMLPDGSVVHPLGATQLTSQVSMDADSTEKSGAVNTISTAKHAAAKVSPSLRFLNAIYGSGEPAMEEWLVMFKNETHNHPTEIEPFGGAATCLGGAIRDPLSGRSYVYQAMRVTGAADPRTPFEETLPGKLPQRKITRGAAHGYSSYGNQIGLATGIVAEVYHPGFVAKRMEIGAVVAACPRVNVVRGTPAPGDLVVLAGGRTGRDGIGGATGSSKEHTETALQNSAEVQKGDAPTERKLQRLFRDPAVARLIKRCNDFGAGGVSVAVGELAPSLEIDLDAVPLKYDGLDGTELAISESQERMAVVLAPADVDAFRAAAARENIETAIVARVTADGRMRMHWRGQEIVSLRRDFLDTNGARPSARARVCELPAPPPLAPAARDVRTRYLEQLSQLNVCSQRGLGERFDASIGAATVLHPFGGKHQVTPIEAMAAKLPVPDGDTDTCTLMSHGYNPCAAQPTPGHGAILAIVEAVTRITAAGGNPARVRLTLQEYFEKLGADPTRWGKPLAALLGAFKAQMELGIPAIGGKDSMSGTFKTLDVPPTLVAFALVPAKASQVLSPEFKHPGSTLLLLPAPLDTHTGLPALPLLRKQLAGLHQRHIKTPGALHAARSIRQGGLGAAIAEMAFGNRIGVHLTHRTHTPGHENFFTPHYGSLILEVADTPAGKELARTLLAWRHPALPIGHTIAQPHITWENPSPPGSIPIHDLQTAWEHPLESTFPTSASK